MAKTTQNYDHAGNKKLSNYVRLKYRNQLSNGALQLYLLGMPYLEQKQSGFCQQVTANYDEIAKAACKDYSGLKKPLLELQNVLCDIQIGKPIMDGKTATVFRRYLLAELKEEKRKSQIIDKNPVHAKKLSEILESRSFVYGDNPVCKPYWNISKTGRVLSSKPNVQGDSKRNRANNLRHGLQDGQVLFDLDIEQAEPTIIQQVIGYRFASDPYDLLGRICGYDRNKAKSELNKIAYAASSATRIIRHWPPKAQKVFTPYAEALDQYKGRLWELWKPNRGQRRFTKTLGGSRIVADRGGRTHKGQVLNWHIQGTVADVINTSCLEIIQGEEAKGWKLLFPEHDSIYVVGKIQQSEELKQLIIKEAGNLSIVLSVNVTCYTVGKIKQQKPRCTV